MSKRKTINVAEVRYTVNHILATATHDDDKHRQYRMGMILLLEDILMKSGNYKGYSYLAQDDVPTDCRPGIRRHLASEFAFVDTDETRRYYYS